ncbi:glycosyltransferase, partial [Candidatus Bipolaricaulota bacterium]|nr:glycosyltransferase [Candidatus Bipolaricaulota bacterium]
LVVAVGNLHPRKGLEELVTAASQVAADVPTAYWVVVGRDDGMGPELRTRIERAGLQGRVRLVGPREDVARILAAADVVVHPSRQEGFSNVVLEAMAAARPLIVTDVGGNAEAVVHGESGLVVSAQDPDALAGAIKRLLADPEEAERLGTVARRRVEELFTIDRMVGGVAAMYEDLVSRRDGGIHR